MKYQNKDGISLNYTQKNNVHTDLVKEVISEAIRMLRKDRQFPHVTCDKVSNFLKENFDIVEIDDFIGEKKHV